MKSYIQDTNDFLKKIVNLPLLPDDLILCATDIVGLYPDILHEEELIAIRRALDSRKNKTISTDSLIKLAECVLKNNIFEHDKSVFKQLRGTAIRTKMAPPCAIMFINSPEEDILSKSLLKPLVWWHYFEDNFMMWKNEEEEFQNFLETLNCYHPNKLIAEYSRTKINFLDVPVMKTGNQLVTDLNIKPTDTHQYLHASSCHVFHCKKSIPFSQALHLNRIYSENAFLIKKEVTVTSW